MPELLGAAADLTGSNLTNTASTRRCAFDDAARTAPAHQLRRSRIRHGRDHERHRAHGGYIPYAAPS